MKCGTKDAFERAKDFYLKVLGFSPVREWPEGIMIDTGCGLLEIFSNGPGVPAKGAIRHVAFATDGLHPEGPGDPEVSERRSEQKISYCI